MSLTCDVCPNRIECLTLDVSPPRAVQHVPTEKGHQWIEAGLETTMMSFLYAIGGPCGYCNDTTERWLERINIEAIKEEDAIPGIETGFTARDLDELWEQDLIKYSFPDCSACSISKEYLDNHFYPCATGGAQEEVINEPRTLQPSR